MQRILYVGMKADYGDASRGLSFEESNFHHPLRHQPGVEVEQFDFMEVGQRIGVAAMSRELQKRVVEWRPHLLFFVGFDAKHDPTQASLRWITENTETATLFWSCDDHWRFDDYSSGWVECVDWLVTTDRDALPKYQRIGQLHKVIASQWAVNQRLYRPSSNPPLCEVSFIGQPHGGRAAVLENLLRQNVAVQVFGFGWRQDIPRLDLQDMVQVFARSKINLNLANSSVPGSQQIKGRNFEVPGCGGFLLTQPVPHLGDYFELGAEIAVFHDEDDLLRQIRYYLANPEERQSIADRGLSRCLAEHTWDHRLQAIFEHVGFYQMQCKQPAGAAIRVSATETVTAP